MRRMNQADQKAIVARSRTVRDLHQMLATEGNGEAIARRMFDVQRFTREEHEGGRTEGWRLYGGWYQRTCSLVWAWFRRDIKEGRKQWK